MIFWFDRLQFDSRIVKLIIFEFFETSEKSINKININSWNEKLAEAIYNNFTLKNIKL